MATWDNITHNVRDTIDHLAEGWQELWQKARNSITHFSPSSDGATPPARSNSWGVLSAEMQETDKSLEVSIEAPGMDAADFNIRVEGKVLIISGTRTYSDQRDEGHYHITERAYGSFQRSFSLPCDVDDSKAKASYAKGVLAVQLPKSSATQPRRISVEA